MLYYDEVELTDPLKSRAGVHKLGVFYFSVRNLGGSELSKLSNIYLVAVFYYEDVKGECFISY